jgi:hypothetical protein
MFDARLSMTALVAAVMLAACASASPMASAKPPAAMNTLSAAEKSAGWKLLFDGKDLAGWRGYKTASAPSKWTVEDGAITLTETGGVDLMTADEFGDFELSLDWKISPKGNSGIIYLVKEASEASQTYNTGPEMQVLDNDGHADGKLPSHRAGALYDIVAPAKDAVKPVGEWNTARIELKKGHITHWLNGVKMADSSYGDDAWRMAVAASKFKTMPLFGKAKTGHIALQDHGDRVWYRNIKIRPL